MYFDDPTSYKTLAELQELWWIGPLALVISIPFVFQFWKRYISNINWQVPYLSPNLLIVRTTQIAVHTSNHKKSFISLQCML